MFDHSIALLEGKMRIFKLIAGTAHSKTERDGAGKHLDNMTHAIAVLKAAGEIDKRETIAFLRWAEEQPIGDTKLNAWRPLVAIYGLIEALPEVKE